MQLPDCLYDDNTDPEDNELCVFSSPKLVSEANFTFVRLNTQLSSGIGMVKLYSRTDFNLTAISMPGNFAIDFTRSKTESVMN